MNKSRIPRNTQQCKNMAEVQDYIIKSNKENGIIIFKRMFQNKIINIIKCN